MAWQVADANWLVRTLSHGDRVFLPAKDEEKPLNFEP